MSYTRVDQLLMYDLHYGIYTEPWNWGVSFRLNMPTFSKFIDGQRGSQQMVDSDGFIYSRKKPKDTALYSAWRCRKRTPPTKCPCHAYLTLMDNSLTLGSKHNHPADNAAPQRREVLSTLKTWNFIISYQLLNKTYHLLTKYTGIRLYEIKRARGISNGLWGSGH